MKRYTDKDRLDWLGGQRFTRSRGLCWQGYGNKFVAYDEKIEGRGNTVRQAIDRAMAAEREKNGR